MQWIGIIVGFDHVVLFVAAHAVLRAKSGGDVESAQGHQRIQRVAPDMVDGSRMSEQRDAPTL